MLISGQSHEGGCRKPQTRQTSPAMVRSINCRCCSVSRFRTATDPASAAAWAGPRPVLDEPGPCEAVAAAVVGKAAAGKSAADNAVVDNAAAGIVAVVGMGPRAVADLGIPGG